MSIQPSKIYEDDFPARRTQAEIETEEITVRRVLEIIAERRLFYYERHDLDGLIGCRALDGASHAIAKAFRQLADQPDYPCPCPCHFTDLIKCLCYPTCCNLPGVDK